MSLTAKNWEHSEGDHRVENIAAFDAVIDEHLTYLALRFISQKGLSAEFADALEDLQNQGDDVIREAFKGSDGPEP
ncbi:hypothetical protein ACGYLO_18720 [Sulfitobacter sp. 1A13353]|jgi:hypothetical protein|uniref:hypothetical protein n=1 Tax=Sulfitobacter sp. 1A13353 TaxID=3368568 RepID=UPI0037464165